MKRLKLKKGMMVKVLVGKERGKTAKIERVFHKKNAVILEGLNRVKKHIRPQKQGQKGQIVDMEMPIHASNVAIVKNDKKQ